MKYTRDLLAGLLFTMIGLGAMILARDYEFGSTMRMGPGYFPTVIGGVIAVLGVIVAVRALLHPESSEPMGWWAIRPLILVLAAVVVFGLLVRSMGLIAAIVAVIVIGRFAAPNTRLTELVVMSLLLCSISAILFVYGLNMPFHLGPWQ